MLGTKASVFPRSPIEAYGGRVANGELSEDSHNHPFATQTPEPGAEVENGQGSRVEGNPAAKDTALTALVIHGGQYELALRNAVQLWAEAKTASMRDRREDLIQAKIAAVLLFFSIS